MVDYDENHIKIKIYAKQMSNVDITVENII